jgi:hypothetical protein
VITDAILDFFGALVGFVMGELYALVPAVPGWANSAVDNLAEVKGWVMGFDTWLPVGLAFTVAAAVGAVWLVGILIGVGRVVASYLTLGGGAT